jgi:hypothetical protein
MKGWTLITVGGVGFVVGGVWFLQGIGVIGGSFMTSSPTWLVIGLVVAVAGLVATALGARGLRKQV